MNPTTIIVAYLRAGYAAEANVVVIDWGALSGNEDPLPDIPVVETLAILPLYIQATYNVDIVGKRVQEFLSFLRNNGLLPRNVHLVGGSLGAHVMGMAGKYYQDVHGEPIARISGIDPGACIIKCFLDGSVNFTE